MSRHCWMWCDTGGGPGITPPAAAACVGRSSQQQSAAVSSVGGSQQRALEQAAACCYATRGWGKAVCANAQAQPHLSLECIQLQLVVGQAEVGDSLAAAKEAHSCRFCRGWWATGGVSGAMGAGLSSQGRTACLHAAATTQVTPP
jgi:hypothetical protein